MVLSFLVRFEKGAYTHTHQKGDYFFLSKTPRSVRPSSQIKREISVVLLLLYLLLCATQAVLLFSPFPKLLLYLLLCVTSGPPLHLSLTEAVTKLHILLARNLGQVTAVALHEQLLVQRREALLLISGEREEVTGPLGRKLLRGASGEHNGLLFALLDDV